MPRVIRSTIMDAPIEAVWDVIRDFNGHDQWHPAVASSQVEHGQDADRVGCVRNFRLAGGENLREQLLTLSDLEQTFTYCLLDTPVPLFNYVAHVRLIPVTDGDHTYWQWEGNFSTFPEQKDELARMVGDDIYQAGFDAIRAEMGLVH